MADARGLVLGEIAVRRGLLTAVQLSEAVAEQAGSGYGVRLGEVLIRRGWVTPDQLDTLLVEQRRTLEQLAADGGLFGRLAVERGWAAPSAVDGCVRTQLALDERGLHVKIGQLMLAYGLLTMERFWQILLEQKGRRGPVMCPTCEDEVTRPSFTRTEARCPGCGHAVFRLEGF